MFVSIFPIYIYKANSKNVIFITGYNWSYMTKLKMCNKMQKEIVLAHSKSPKHFRHSDNEWKFCVSSLYFSPLKTKRCNQDLVLIQNLTKQSPLIPTIFDPFPTIRNSLDLVSFICNSPTSVPWVCKTEGFEQIRRKSLIKYPLIPTDLSILSDVLMQRGASSPTQQKQQRAANDEILILGLQGMLSIS